MNCCHGIIGGESGAYGQTWVTHRREIVFEVPTHEGFRVFKLYFFETFTLYADGVEMLNSVDSSPKFKLST